MSKLDKSALSDALEKSTLSEIYEIEALDYSQVTVTDRFKQRIKEPKQKTKKKLFTKKIAVFFVAAILVSLSIIFTAFAGTRNAIFSFFVEIFEDRVEVTIIDNSTGTSPTNKEKDEVIYPTSIETEFAPEYIEKNGYLEIDKIKGPLSVYTVWTNGDMIIDFTQAIIESTLSLDSESEHQIIYIGSREVILSHKFGVYTAVWAEHNYLFTMSCDDVLSVDEVKEIIGSLTKIENPPPTHSNE